MYRWGVFDFAGTFVGEPMNAYEKGWTPTLNGLDTARMKLRLDDRLADDIFTRDGDVFGAVFRGSTLEFLGELQTAEELGDDEGRATVSCVFAGPLQRLQKRLIGKSVAGFSWVGISPSDVFKELLAWTNDPLLFDGYDTGIRPGSLPGLQAINVGPWIYKPIKEAYEEMATLLLPPFVARQTPAKPMAGSGTLEGTQTDELGNSWVFSGATNAGYFVNPYPRTDCFTLRGYYHLGGSSDFPSATPAGSSFGRIATVQITPIAHTIAQVDFMDMGGSGISVQKQGSLMVRYVNDSNFAVLCWSPSNSPASPYGQQSIGFFLWVGDGVIHGTTSAVTMTPGTWYSARVEVTPAGVYKVWFWPSSSPMPATPVLSTTRSELATGGVLDDGKVSIAEATTMATADAGMIFSNFSVVDPTGLPIGLDFEIVPNLPVADTYLGADGIITHPGVKIGTLNIGAPLGAVKPDAVFEYGFETQASIKTYRRFLDRQGMMTRGISLPSDWPTSTDVRTSEDAAAIVARGLYEDIVQSDVVDGDLRKALVDEHVSVRKKARTLASFEPIGPNAPVYGVDYKKGDWVKVHAKVNNVARLGDPADLARVYSADITEDENGKVSTIPTFSVA